MLAVSRLHCCERSYAKRVVLEWQGDIMGNTFGGNTCQGGRGGSVFRTVSSGSVGSDQGLQDEMDADVRAPTCSQCATQR